MELFEDKTDKQLEHFKEAVLYALAMVEVEIQRRKNIKVKSR
jgi:hypothetical protein